MTRQSAGSLYQTGQSQVQSLSLQYLGQLSDQTKAGPPQVERNPSEGSGSLAVSLDDSSQDQIPDSQGTS